MMCEGINCGSGTCIRGICICDPNYVNIDNFCEETSQDNLITCEGISCGRGACYNGTCECETGYANVANECEETCALKPCQDLIKT